METWRKKNQADSMGTIKRKVGERNIRENSTKNRISKTNLHKKRQTGENLQEKIILIMYIEEKATKTKIKKGLAQKNFLQSIQLSGMDIWFKTVGEIKAPRKSRDYLRNENSLSLYFPIFRKLSKLNEFFPCLSYAGVLWFIKLRK